ncbi:MAG: hypothetical protein IPL61_18155 [Myxococcales bacterium]|nr:hypothetical protein [Myxococcales bacterium]
MTITNPAVRDRAFLQELFEDDYFPNPLVEKGKQILLRLCARIEAERPVGDAVLPLTHAATEEFNQLDEELHEHDSEIETAARECIGADMMFILQTYGYQVDIEDAIAPRDW